MIEKIVSYVLAGVWLILTLWLLNEPWPMF
jgi:hypothetical protein